MSRSDHPLPPSQPPTCYGFTYEDKACRNSVIGSRFCGQCWGSSDHALSYAGYSLERIDENEQQSLLHHPDEQVRRALGANPAATAETLRILSQDTDEQVRAKVAANRNAAVDTIRVLAADLSVAVRIQAARHSPAPVDILTSLTQDDSEDVRAALLKRDNTPLQVVRILLNDSKLSISMVASEYWMDSCDDDSDWKLVAEHPSANLRWMASRNPRLPRRFSQSMAQSDDCDLLRNLCVHQQRHSDIRNEALQQLLRVNQASTGGERWTPVDWAMRPMLTDGHVSPESFVALAEAPARFLSKVSWKLLAQHSSTPSFALAAAAQKRPAHEDPDTVSAALQHRNCDTEVLQAALSGYGDDTPTEILVAIAEHPQASAEIMGTLSRSQRPAVMKAVCDNPNTPPDRLAVRSRSRNFKIRLRVARNPSTPADVLIRLAKDSNIVRARVVENTSCPVEALEMLSRDPAKDIRKGVSVHPSAPDDLLLMLAMDESAEVSEAAAQELANRKQADE